MNGIFSALPDDVSLDRIGSVRARRWTLDADLAQPSIDIEPSEWAYVAEVDSQDREDPLLLSPDERRALSERIGGYRLYTVRYASPSLGRAVARAIAGSELSERPMLVDIDDTFVPPAEFLERTSAERA